MTMRDGIGWCDGCGRPVGNAGIDQAVVVTTITDDGEPLTLHLCRQPRTEDEHPGGHTEPCAARVLNTAVFRYLSDRTLPGPVEA